MKKEWLRFGAPPPYKAVVLVEHRGPWSTPVFIWRITRGHNVVATGEASSGDRATRALLERLQAMGMKV